MQLLPKDQEVGWTPYAFLIYLLVFPLYAFAKGTGVIEWIATVLALVSFLVLYFRGYWLDGKDLLPTIGLIFLLGAAFMPLNPSALVFFIYGAAFVGRSGDANFAARILLAMLCFIGLETWVLHLSVPFLIQALLFPILVGAVNIHHAQRRRDNQKLLRAQEQVEQMAKIAERERIARDLHDVLGHTLSVIILKSELASKVFETDLGRAINEIRDVERISRDALTQVRSTVRGYQALGLEAEFGYVKNILQASGIEVSCDFRSVVLSPPQEQTLALALREATTNILRHSRAKTCTLSLRQVDTSFQLEIQDDGCGLMGDEGVGLSGMRQRVEALGGSLKRQIGSGTQLIITLPVGPK